MGLFSSTFASGEPTGAQLHVAQSHSGATDKSENNRSRRMHTEDKFHRNPMIFTMPIAAQMESN